MKNVLRVFVAAWYLLGWMSHVYLGLFAPQTYRVFGDTALLPQYGVFWQAFMMPNISFFALLLAVFEIGVGLMLISKGKWVRIGLIFSILFNLFLVQMGLGFPAATSAMDFAANRLPNLIFIVLQIPLLWGRFEYSIAEILQKKLRPAGS